MRSLPRNLLMASLVAVSLGADVFESDDECAEGNCALYALQAKAAKKSNQPDYNDYDYEHEGQGCGGCNGCMWDGECRSVDDHSLMVRPAPSQCVTMGGTWCQNQQQQYHQNQNQQNQYQQNQYQNQNHQQQQYQPSGNPSGPTSQQQYQHQGQRIPAPSPPRHSAAAHAGCGNDMYSECTRGKCKPCQGHVDTVAKCAPCKPCIECWPKTTSSAGGGNPWTASTCKTCNEGKCKPCKGVKNNPKCKPCGFCTYMCWSSGGSSSMGWMKYLR